MNKSPHYITDPFLINTEQHGTILVLKCIKMCGISKLEQKCVVPSKKITTPCSPVMDCKRPSSPKCYRDNNIPFFGTNVLENMFTSEKNSASRILG
ncbi:DNA-binding phosphoprotein [Cetacean poxvirus 1]|nr:DNA-binding phosphoprotein [Cetacean poxvirus 1]